MPIDPLDQYLVVRALNQFPASRTPLPTSGAATLRARAASHAAYVAAQEQLSNLGNASRFEDPDLASERRHDLREAVDGQLRARTRGQFAEILHLTEQANRETQAAAEPFRPKLDHDSVPQLLQTDSAWNNIVLPALQAGKQWADIIPTLDVTGLLAVERYAAAYVNRIAQTIDDKHQAPSVIASIREASERRLPDVVPPEGRTALLEAQQTADAVEFVRNVGGWVDHAEIRNLTGLSISVKRAAGAANAIEPVAVPNTTPALV